MLHMSNMLNMRHVTVRTKLVTVSGRTEQDTSCS
jgi:hypothetical protein